MTSELLSEAVFPGWAHLIRVSGSKGNPESDPAPV